MINSTWFEKATLFNIPMPIKTIIIPMKTAFLAVNFFVGEFSFSPNDRIIFFL